MKEALKAAATDIGFQFFLAKLFGTPQKVLREGKELYGWIWREQLFVVKVIDHATPEPDSHQ